MAKGTPISPTIMKLHKFQKYREAEEKDLKTSNNLAEIWRRTSKRRNPIKRKERRGQYFDARAKYMNARANSLRLAEELVRLEAVTVRNKDDINSVVELDEGFGLLGVVRMREGHFDSGGPAGFHDLASHKGLTALAVD